MHIRTLAGMVDIALTKEEAEIVASALQQMGMTIPPTQSRYDERAKILNMGSAINSVSRLLEDSKNGR